MGDPLSTVVAIGGLISLADLVLARGFKCLKYLRQVKNAEKEVSKLLDETSSVSGLFSWVLKEIEEAQIKSASGVELEIRQHVNRCHETLEKFQAWLMRFSKESTAPVGEDEGEANPQKKSKWTWPFSTKEVTDMTAELQRRKADVVVALSTDNWINAKASLGLQREIVDSLTDIRTLVTRNLSVVEAQGSAKETKVLLDWLTTYDPTESHQNAQETHQEGTGEWILEQPEYKEWIASSSAGLWLYGIAGAGKTVLASVVIESLFKTVPQGVAYYYCSYKSSVSQEARNVLGSLCRQLVLQNLDCLKDLDELYKKHHPKGLPPKPLREEALGAFLQEISRRFACATVVVDGLDECGAAAGIDRSRLVQILSALHTDEASRVRLIVSSRKELDIEQAFRHKFASVPIAAKPADLRLYVRAEVAKRRSGLRFGTVEVREQVIETLIEKADGMFQWCRCQLDDLDRLPSDEDRLEALNQLPKDLPDTYIRILERIDRDYPPKTTTLVKRALKWLVLKNQGYGGELPLLALAQAISLSDQSPNSFNFKRVPHPENLIEWCSSLVSLNKKGDYLELSHFTVEEFLRENPESIASSAARSYLVNSDVDYFYLAETCLRYLSCEDFDQSSIILNPKSFSEFIKLYPFYCHAAVHLPDYLLALKSDMSSAPTFARFFSRQNPQMFLFWSRFISSYHESGTSDDMMSWYSKGRSLTLLQAAAGFLLVSTTRQLLQNGYDANEDDGYKASALHLCVGGPISSNELYYNSPYSPGRDIVDRLETDPEDHASRREQIALLLVAAGADVNRMSEWGYRTGKRSYRELTPLGVAIYYLRPGLCRLLLDHGATLLPTKESFGEEFSTLDDIITEVLVESDSNSATNQTFDVLMATESCKDHLWKLLGGRRDTDDEEDEDVNPEAEEKRALGTALVLAAGLGNLTTVRIALKKGADVDFFYEEDEETALMAATKEKFADIIAELLQHGASIDTPCKGGDSPLTWLARSSESGLKQARKLFGDPGIALTGQRKVDALRRACRSQNSDLLDFIQEQGVEVPKDSEPLNLSDDNTLTGVEYVKAAGDRGMLSENDRKITFLSAVGSGRADIVEYLVQSTDLALLRSFQPLPEVSVLDPSPERAYAVLASHGFFLPDQIPKLLKQAKDEGLTELEKIVFTFSVAMDHMDDDGNYPIHRACALNDPSLLQHCLDAGAEVNQRNMMDDTPLHVLAANEFGSNALFPSLLSRGADVSLRGEKGETPLHRLVKRKYWSDTAGEACALLLAAGADPNSPRDEDKRTPLHLAARVRPESKLFSQLMKSGADASLLNAEQKTPVRDAVPSNSFALEFFLSELGRDAVVKTPDPLGRLALHDAAILSTPTTCTMLLDAGADVDAADNYGQTALHLACCKDTNRVVPLLLEKGAKPEVCDETGATAVHKAAQCHGTYNLKELLRAGAPVSPEDNLGNTPLLRAALFGSTKNIDLLLEHGAGVNASNTAGSTALHLAAGLNHTAAVIALLNAGASLDAVDESGMTPLDTATYSSASTHKTCAKLLRRKGAKTAAELASAQQQQPTDVVPVNPRLLSGGLTQDFRLLKSLGVDITARNWDGQTALHGAVWSGSLESVNYLLDQEGLDAHAADYAGHMPLHLACALGNLQIAERLLRVVPRPPGVLRVISPAYGTPLAAAASSGNAKLVEMLLDAGAGVDEGGHPWLGPPLFVAVSFERRENAVLLLARGAKTSSMSGRFRTAREVAVRCGRLGLLSILADEDEDEK